MIAGINTSGSGLNSRMFRLTDVVGCCEKIITVSTIPASDCMVMSVTSHHFMVFLRFHS